MRAPAVRIKASRGAGLPKPGASRRSVPRPALEGGALRSRRKFLRYYPGGFEDRDYLELERGYKLTAHERWLAALGRDEFNALISDGAFTEIAARAVKIESRT